MIAITLVPSRIRYKVQAGFKRVGLLSEQLQRTYVLIVGLLNETNLPHFLNKFVNTKWDYHIWSFYFSLLFQNIVDLKNCIQKQLQTLLKHCLCTPREYNWLTKCHTNCFKIKHR